MPQAFHPHQIVTEYARTLIRIKAKQLVRQSGFNRHDQADLEQDLMVYLLGQAEHFDPKRGSLNTFIARVVDSAVAILVRQRQRAKRYPAGQAEVQSLADKVPQAAGPPEALAKLISQLDLERRLGIATLQDSQRFELAHDVASVISQLSPQLQNVCRSLIFRNHKETESALNLSRRGLQMAMKLIREHFVKSNLKKN